MKRTVSKVISVVVALGATLAPATSQADWHYHTGYEFRFHRPVDYHYWHKGGLAGGGLSPELAPRARSSHAELVLLQVLEFILSVRVGLH